MGIFHKYKLSNLNQSIVFKFWTNIIALIEQTLEEKLANIFSAGHTPVCPVALSVLCFKNSQPNLYLT